MEQHTTQLCPKKDKWDTNEEVMSASKDVALTLNKLISNAWRAALPFSDSAKLQG